MPSNLEQFIKALDGFPAAEEQIRHSQKMEAIGRLAESIAHDFNNLVAVISTQAELIMELQDVHAVQRETEVILGVADRAAALTRQLLAFSRKQRLDPKVFNLNDLLRNIDQLLTRLLTEDVELTIALAPDLGNILAEASQIEQVVLNLAVNARDAMPNGGKLTVETSNVELDTPGVWEGVEISSGPYVMLTVTDTGIGMTAEVQSRLFEPFFTTKPAGQGTGLGLSTAYAIVKRARGHIALSSELNRGTTFKVFFPRVGNAVETALTEIGAGPPANKGAVILLVEDEEHLRCCVRQLLQKAGYVVFVASHAIEALHICEENHYGIDLVLTDIGLPHIRGPQLLDLIRNRHPQMKAVFMSGFGPDSLRPEEKLCLSGSFIQKPFRKESLIRKIEQALNDKSLSDKNEVDG
jgi:two-component system, cell cycle sensor histidine kinase and response regulator CckA